VTDLPGASAPSRPWARRLLLAAAALLLGLLAFVAWQWRPGDETPEPGNPDPRLTYPTPYRNVRPEVKYVGDRACAGCHAEESAAYRQHPMGRSLAPVAAAAPVERYGWAALNPFLAADPFVGPGLHYGVQLREKCVYHQEWAADPHGKVLAEREAEVHFVVGSGQRGRAYLVNQDGYLFQSPITWYAQAGRWDLSPGYAMRNQHFSRPIMPGCLFCHCNHADHVAGTMSRYRLPIFQGYAIGCERCHGPGELHVRRRAAGEEVAGRDDTIVNPARLEPALREAVCQQCHLQGAERIVGRGRSDFDYRPGLPLHLFLMDFVLKEEHPEELKFVGSVEQMAASRCYRASREPRKLGCISCHDPHRLPAPGEKVAHYRQRCLRCHTEQSCNLPAAARRAQNREDSCIACHMPPTGSEIRHTSVTDHRIPRRPAGRGGAAPAPRLLPSPAGLVPFHRDLVDLQDKEVARNRGLALMALLDRQPPEAAARQLAEESLPLLEDALQRDRQDWQAWQAKAGALLTLGRPEEALAAFEKLLAAKPDWESALQPAASLAFALNQRKAGRAYLERAVQVNPWSWRYHHLLAATAFQGQEWDRAARDCQRSLRLEPFYSSSRRKLLVECYLRLGLKEEAQAEFEKLLQLSPEGRRPELRRWLDGQRR
jgi:tetratricopeptide (TPR) repeat protein